MNSMMARAVAISLAPMGLALLLAACSSTPPTPEPPPEKPQLQSPSSRNYFRLDVADHATEIVMFAMGLLDVGYRFGGRNPDAGLDCSGMVSYVVEKVAGKMLPHNAAKIAEITRPINRAELRPADLVFFNTNGKPYSHMGIYLGDGRFVHAPSTNGVVRLERMDSPYFGKRFVAARTLF